MKILLGERNRFWARALASIFSQHGHIVDIVPSSTRLLQNYEMDHYNLILVDTRLNSIFITCTIRELEALPNRKFTPIVGLFSQIFYGPKVSYFRYFRAGMNDLLRKPLSREDIDKVIEKYLF